VLSVAPNVQRGDYHKRRVFLFLLSVLSVFLSANDLGN